MQGVVRLGVEESGKQERSTRTSYVSRWQSVMSLGDCKTIPRDARTKVGTKTPRKGGEKKGSIARMGAIDKREQKKEVNERKKRREGTEGGQRCRFIVWQGRQDASRPPPAIIIGEMEMFLA